MYSRAEKAEVVARDRAEWRRWLERHHATSDGVWLLLAKKGSGLASVTYEEAVEEALCFGWIDAKANSLDDRRYRQWMVRRKPGGGWSASNKARSEAAKADGSWSRLEGSQALRVPADLAKAMRAYPNAREHFDAFPPSARRAILQWIDDAKKSETRARRVEETARLAQENARANQPRPDR